MSSDKAKVSKTTTPATTPTTVVAPPPLFRRLDWITAGLTALITLFAYVYTLAPDVTLEDSGELAVASYYAGVPHPPGYPVWTLYTWLFTQIPFSNIAWRVALSSAVAASLACGLLALLVSRGSSMLLEGLPDFKTLDQRLESLICLIAGAVAGCLLGFNGFMWSQAVIVEVYTLSVLSFMGVLCSLLRWIYAPEQRRYLYWSFFWFGICFTNHQTLVVAAMGIEVAILAAHPKLGRDMFLGNGVVYLFGLVLKWAGYLTAFDQNLPLFMVYNAVGLSSLAVAVYYTLTLGKPLTEWKPILISLACWLAGALFYLYMPLASMSNPPLNWGYPRTEEGFWHALTRGQYDKTNPTDSVFRFVDQVAMYFGGAIEEFGLVLLLIGLIPFLFFTRMQRRERAWIVGLTAIYLLLAFLLLILLNPNTDKQSRDQTRVFFTSSHIVISIAIGYGITLVGGMLGVFYEKYRKTMLWAGAIACGLQLYFVLDTFGRTQFPLPRAADLIGFLAAAAFTGFVLLNRQKAPVPLLLALFALAPLRSVLANWSDAEQRGHLFGYWFGHDMFTPPFNTYPEMAKQAVLFGGTDPGRFNPTYMIFCESFTPARCKPRDPAFDRRDVYLITQNALADKTYLDYIRAHYNRSAQKDPYFFSELLRSDRETEDFRTNLLSRMALPLDRLFTAIGERIEAKRRADKVYPPKEIITPSNDDSQIAFTEYITDAGRRLQHDSQFPNEPRQVRPGEDIRIIDNKVQVSGQVAVMAINALLTKVIFDKNPDHEFYVEESFPLDWMFPHLTPFGIIMKINRQPLATLPEEVLQKDHTFWRKYSERFIGDWIDYDTSVKEICDFVERTYIRRDFTGFKGDRKFVRDEFAQKAFSKLRSAIGGLYSWRTISPDCPPEYRPKTPEDQQRLLKEADFALRQAFAFCPYSPEAVYKYVQLLLNFGRLSDAVLIAETGLKFDPANSALFGLVSQLRSMRPPNAAATPAGPAENPGQAPEYAALETSFRASPTNTQLGLQLAQSYLAAQRYDAVVPVLRQTLDSPHADITEFLTAAQILARLGNRTEVESTLEKLRPVLTRAEARFQASSQDVPLAFQVVSGYLVTQQTNQAVALTDTLVGRTNADASTFASAAQVYSQLQDIPRLEKALRKLVESVPTHPEAWYDLAAVQISLGKRPEGLSSLRQSLELSDARMKARPGSKDLRDEVRKDARLAALQADPEFKRVMGQR